MIAANFATNAVRAYELFFGREEKQAKTWTRGTALGLNGVGATKIHCEFSDREKAPKKRAKGTGECSFEHRRSLQESFARNNAAEIVVKKKSFTLN